MRIISWFFFIFFFKEICPPPPFPSLPQFYFSMLNHKELHKKQIKLWNQKEGRNPWLFSFHLITFNLTERMRFIVIYGWSLVLFFSLCCVFFLELLFLSLSSLLLCFYLAWGGGSPTTLEKNAWHSDRKWKLLEKRYNSLQVSWRVCLFPTGHFGAASGRKRCLPPRCSSFPVAWKQTETNPLHLPVCLQLAFYFNLINEKCLCSNKMFWILVELHFLKRLALSF